MPVTLFHLSDEADMRTCDNCWRRPDEENWLYLCQSARWQGIICEECLRHLLPEGEKANG